MMATSGAPRVSARPHRPEQPRRLVGLAVTILAVTLIPYCCGYLLAPAGKSFLGALNNVGDLSQYIAAIRQGSNGAWQYTNQFTPDHARKLFIYTPYLLAGHLSPGFSPMLTFHILRLLCAALLLYALAQFCRLFIGRLALRACWLFVALAGGLYWLALPLSAFAPRLVDSASLTAPELSPLIAMLVSPHESLGLACELLGFLNVLRASGATEALWSETRPRAVGGGKSKRYALQASGWFFVLALSYPFLLPTVGLVLACYAAVAARSAWSGRFAAATLKRRLRPADVFVSEIQSIVIALAPAGVVGLYYLDVFHRDPLWSHSGLATVGRPDLGVLLFAFGALAFGAYRGIGRLRLVREAGGDAVPTAWAWFPVIWGAVNFCTLMLPIWQQGRQALGLTVPLALLGFLWLTGPRVATEGMQATLPSLPASAIVFSSPLLIALYTAITAAGVNKGYYVPANVMQAVDWIGHNATEHDVVLASAGFGNLVPETCACRVVVGQNFQTFNWLARQTEVHAFYGAQTQAKAITVLRDIVRREGVTLVVYSPLERNIGHMELRHLAGFTTAVELPGTTVLTRKTSSG